MALRIASGRAPQARTRSSTSVQVPGVVSRCRLQRIFGAVDDFRLEEYMFYEKIRMVKEVFRRRASMKRRCGRCRPGPGQARRFSENNTTRVDVNDEQ